MRLSRASSHAVRAVAHLTRQPPGRVLASHAVAEVEGAPRFFLLKLMRALAAAGVLLSVKGPHGGYRLARPAKAISLLEVVEAVDGPLRGGRRP